jgi:hypothetical protein
MISAYQQFEHHADGTITVKGFPDLAVEVIADQGRVVGRDIEKELRLPKYRDDWEHLATSRGLSARQCRFVLMDESETRFPGQPRLRPQQIMLPTTCYLEFAHRGFIVGVVNAFLLGFDEQRTSLPSLLGIDLPTDMEGDYIIGQAILFDSPLADAAWLALQRGLFTHVCPLILREHPETEPVGTGRLVEVSLTSDDYPGCANARILAIWTA